jgi:hypothetical protein
MWQRARRYSHKNAVRLLSTFLVLAAIASSSAALCGPFVLYISPNGNDGNEGTKENPVQTLSRVDDILIAEAPTSDVVIYVRSDQGPYLDQRVEWRYFDSAHRTVIKSDPENTKARFLCTRHSEPLVFFTLMAEEGCPSNIEINNLSIESYASGALIFKGDLDNRQRWNGNNIIRNCSFANIGNYDSPNTRGAYSAIGLINSRNNTIIDCEFTNIKNHTAATYPQNRIERHMSRKEIKKYPNILEYREVNRKGGGWNPNLPIIAIYIAHHSDSNAVIKNSFKNIKGDVVRVRDDSNNNVIADNNMNLVGWQATITAWYCDPGKNECTARHREKPSFGTIIIGNTIKGNWLYGMPRIYADLTTEELLTDVQRQTEKEQDDIIKRYGIEIRDNKVSTHTL